MKKLTIFMSLMLGFFLFIGSAYGSTVTLLDEDFSSQTIEDGLWIELRNNPGDTSDDNLQTWVDFPNTLRWQIATSGGDPGFYARHLSQTNEINMLYYGMEISSIAEGALLSLDFDYIATTAKSYTPEVYLVGMTYGTHYLDPFGPWFDKETSTDGTFDTNLQYVGTDGDVIDKWSLSKRDSWTIDPMHFETILPMHYDVLVLGFKMGGFEGGPEVFSNRGVDNVLITATVPEPSTMLLLGLGLFGLVGFRRES